MTNMTIGRISHHPRGGAWMVALAAGALTAVLSTAAPAVASDPQEGAVKTDKAHQLHAVRRHAAAPAYQSGADVSARRGYRSGPYARARSSDRYGNSTNDEDSTSNTPPKPHKDFQDFH